MLFVRKAAVCVALAAVVAVLPARPARPCASGDRPATDPVEQHLPGPGLRRPLREPGAAEPLLPDRPDDPLRRPAGRRGQPDEPAEHLEHADAPRAAVRADQPGADRPGHPPDRGPRRQPRRVCAGRSERRQRSALPPYGSGGGSTYASTSSLGVAMAQWMYDDGANSPNVDCPAAGAPGCWAHRQIILGRYAAPALMGVGYGHGTAQLFVGGDTVDTPYFTWSQVTPVPPRRRLPLRGQRLGRAGSLADVDVPVVGVGREPGHPPRAERRARACSR